MTKPPKACSADSECPCASGASYAVCCAPYLAGNCQPETAEQLMRSRYSAYVLQAIDYLYRTTHPDKRTVNLKAEIADWASQVEFEWLKVIAVRHGQLRDKRGKVEFIASYRLQQQPGELHEVSRFRRYQRNWFYYDGEIS